MIEFTKTLKNRFWNSTDEDENLEEKVEQLESELHRLEAHAHASQPVDEEDDELDDDAVVPSPNHDEIAELINEPMARALTRFRYEVTVCSRDYIEFYVPGTEYTRIEIVENDNPNMTTDESYRVQMQYEDDVDGSEESQWKVDFSDEETETPAGGVFMVEGSEVVSPVEALKIVEENAPHTGGFSLFG